MKNMLDLWIDCKHNKHWHERKMNKGMKLLNKWTEQAREGKLGNSPLNSDLMDSFKKFMESAMETTQKESASTSGSNRHGDHIGNTQTEEPAKRSSDTMRGSSGHSSALNSSDLNIIVYKSGEAASVTRIPESTLKLAGKFAKAYANFQAQDVDLEEVVRLIERSNVQGTILEHERPKEEIRIVISVGESSKKTLREVDQGAPAVDLKIRTYKDGETSPMSITTVCGGILCSAENVIPASALEAMCKNGVALDEIARFSMDPNAKGVTILDHEDLKKQERVVISLE